MLAAQIATSSIWFDVRYSQALEIPARVIATHLADLVRVAERDPQQLPRMVELLDSPNFQLSIRDTSRSTTDVVDADRQSTQRLLEQVLSDKLGHAQPLSLLQLALLDDQGKAAGLPALLSARPTVGQFLIELRLPDGRWLSVDAREQQGWSSRGPWDLILDYVLRIYLLRIAVVVILALVAVRLAIRPLNQLTEAARQLGQNIQRPPLSLSGPSEVRRAAEAFNVMQQRLIANIAERTRFLAAISHDLRSPITRMRLRTELLAETAIKDHLRRDLEHMEQMVVSTLDFASSSEVTEPRDNIDINALLRSLQADLQDMGESMQLSGQANAPLPGYARSLKRCVQNLVENGVRYGGRVEVWVEDTPDLLCIRICDQGPGIAQDLLDKVLEPFYRVDPSRNTGTGGYGLGLSIAHAVVMAHGGRLLLSNRQTGGLEAMLEFPRHA
ncbi:ATP-binding protein [Pseudomonas sp. NA-150]|uniref:ATP-binding protein n=1 Tax=Pseudomonas sp. NA-150 TaxID=3367525 RepID=UPI0037C89978